mgnify:CR=1 FL=1
MFKGSNVALITPFKNNKLDIEAYIKIIHFQLENGTNAVSYTHLRAHET